MNKIIFASGLITLFAACGQQTPPNTTTQPTNTPPSTAIYNLTATQDSLDKVNSALVLQSGDQINHAYVSLLDSSVALTANMRADHRIFGYIAPDIRSQRLLLLSIYTTDVEQNPFQCPLGAYYDTANPEAPAIKYLSTEGDFVKTIATSKAQQSTVLFFEKKWITFDNE